ncbi:YjzD family protein [Oenococcus oeni]
MKYLVVSFWSIILGNVLGFIVGDLSEQTYVPLNVTIMALVVGEVAAFLITAITKSANKKVGNIKKSSGN